MNIEKLPSGKYRARQQIEGVRYTLIFDHIPTQKEITISLSNKIKTEAVKVGRGLSFEDAAQRYINTKMNVLSPSTIRGYDAYLAIIPLSFKGLDLGAIDGVDIQTLVNELSAEKSPKYVRNIYGFISAVFGLYRPDFTLSATLPQSQNKKIPSPTEEHVKAIMERAHGTEYEVALQLACLGLRRSEICALTPEDFKGNIVQISKSLVRNKDGKYVVKASPKTAASFRQLYVPDATVNLIKSQGYVYNGMPGTITRWLERQEEALGLPKYSIHSFRHFFASKMSTLTDEATVLALGGWSTPHVMKRVYREAMEANVEKAKQAAVNLTEGLF